MSYDEFGVPMITADVTQPFGFTGYQTEKITGNSFAQVRYYMPTIGRFSSQDMLKGHPAFP